MCGDIYVVVSDKGRRCIVNGVIESMALDSWGAYKCTQLCYAHSFRLEQWLYTILGC